MWYISEKGHRYTLEISIGNRRKEVRELEKTKTDRQRNKQTEKNRQRKLDRQRNRQIDR